MAISSGPLTSGEQVVEVADRAVRFINNLTCTGDYAGQPFRLRDWQENRFIRPLFGTLRPDGTMQYRRAFWALPRKNGKTELTAAIALYRLLGQRRKGRHVYCASGDTEQASLIFAAAKAMVEADPRLSAMCRIYHGDRKRIEYEKGQSFLKVLSSAADLKHGLNPSDVIIDELHIVDRELYNVLTTAFGARRDPLLIMITTAGWDRESVCYEQWDYARKVRDGIHDDPETHVVIYEPETDEQGNYIVDWKDEATWFKVNPALGDFRSLDSLRGDFKRAMMIPAEENTFKQLYLNIWTQQATRWLSVEAWNACQATILEAGQLEPAAAEG